jgi:hypothetical protein
VTRCDCWRDAISTRLMSAARIPRRYEHCDLSGFMTYGNASLEDALSRAK